jgi:hypothetical protein
MEEYANSDEVKILPCRHYFHSVCAKGWLEVQSEIPFTHSLVVFI